LNPSANLKPGSAEEGDYIRIKLSNESNEDDEVLHVERIITKLLGNHRSVTMMTRPVRLKTIAGRVEHIVGRDTTYTFVVQLNEAMVTSGLYVKDESSSGGAEGLYDKISHALKELFAWTEPFKTNWHKLMESIIK
jgi:hypothetical protein